MSQFARQCSPFSGALLVDCVTPETFHVTRPASELASLAKKKAKHHRSCETYYQRELQRSEQKTRTASVPKHELLDQVRTMTELVAQHRNKAEEYERYARAFACNPKERVTLSVEQVAFFGLEK